MLNLFHMKNLPYISVLTNPTTAGVMASYASLGDIIIAEPKAMIGFAGPRTIYQTIKVELIRLSATMATNTPVLKR